MNVDKTWVHGLFMIRMARVFHNDLAMLYSLFVTKLGKFIPSSILTFPVSPLTHACTAILHTV
jgi:hypothetical protein